VRSESEFKKGAIPGSTLLSLPDLRGKLDTLPKDKNIIVICKIGLRGYLA
jgi:rhodanese-related sulfurtransferase